MHCRAVVNEPVLEGLIDDYVSLYVCVLTGYEKMQGLFSGEIVRDSVIFWPKISLKLAKWEEKSHTKQLFSQTILPVFP